MIHHIVMIKSHYLKLFYTLFLIGLLVLVSGCAKTQYTLKYEVSPQIAEVWPKLPERPRVRYVGTLIGEQNVYEVEENKRFGNKIADFFLWLVGLRSNYNPNPVILQRPQAGAVDNKGRIFITDVSRHSVLVFDGTKGSLAEWKWAGGISFITPIGIATGENDTIYVADADLGYIVHLNSKGEVIKHFGEETLNRPTGLARDPVNKLIYVVDTHDHNIKVYNDAGDFIEIIGARGIEPGQFNSPTHVRFSGGKLYVTDTMNARVQILSADGDVISTFGKRGSNIGDFVRPKGVTTDSDGNIYVIESLHDYLLVYNTKGQLLLSIGGSGSGLGQFYLPSGIWTDKNNRIYIADMFNGRVVVLQYLGDDKLGSRDISGDHLSGGSNAGNNTRNNAGEDMAEVSPLTN